ncbi:MAG: dihydrodipicolinate synthase family protein, partial [Bacteroidales bacterium]|nr:dihydrodipicolinate synthase family protein [Bacteroidales bacterium]
GNVIPEVMKSLTELALEGKMKEAEKIHFEYYELFEAIRFESNPMAAKMALNLMGLPAGGHRSPLTPLSTEKTEKLKKIMQKNRLI